jgi:hypothetical protein
MVGINKSNNDGFSFVQVILSLGLLSGLMVAAVKIASNQTKLGKSSSFYFESIDIMDQIKSNFHEPKSCLLSLKNKSATYSKIDKILRFNPEKESGDILFKRGQTSLGQNNVTLQGIELFGDRAGFIETNGYTTMRLKFVGKQKESFSSEFPIRVKLDSFDRIVSCQSSPGIFQNEVQSVASDIWLPTDESISAREGIYSRIVPYQVGKVKNVGSLNVYGGLKIGDERSICSRDTVGTLRFSSKDQRLYYCGDRGVWKSLNRSGKVLKEKKTFEVSSRSSKIKTLETPVPYRICRISRSNFQAGQCWARPLSAGRLETKWELISQYFRGDALKCEFDCYR